MKPVIAIDGPAGAGKSTLARLLAERLHLLYVDTGALYRALAYAARQQGLGARDEPALAELCAGLSLRLLPQAGGPPAVEVEGRVLGEAELRTPEITEYASRIARFPRVRECMVGRQRQLAAPGGVVMEGRDIQTVVWPQAEVKIFLTASARERAHRRFLELQAAGAPVSEQQVRADLARRDRRDATRATAPLRPAPDAVILDTDRLSIAGVLAAALAAVGERVPDLCG